MIHVAFSKDSNQYLLHFDIKMALEAFLDQKKEATDTHRKIQRARARERERIARKRLRIWISNVCKRRWSIWKFWFFSSSFTPPSCTHTHTMCWLISEMEAGIFSIFIQCDAPDVVLFVSKSKSWKGNRSHLYFLKKKRSRHKSFIWHFVLDAIKRVTSLFLKMFAIIKG